MPSEKEVRDEQLADLRAVASMDWGRRFLVRLVDDVCGESKSVMRTNRMCRDDERLVYNGAKQDVGRWLLDELEEASPLAYEAAKKELALKRIEKRKAPKEVPKDIDPREEGTEE